MKHTKIKALLLGIGVSTLLVAGASANTITVGGVPGIAGAGPYTWTYEATLDNGTVNNGGGSPTAPSATAARIVIYDFFGFVPGSQTQPPGWTASTQPVGGISGIDVAVNLLNPDDATRVNLIWTYTSPNPISATGVDSPTVQDLGDFTAVSTSNLRVSDYYGSQDRGLDGNISQSLGPTQVPGPPPPVPDAGATSVLLGMALLGIEGFRRKLVRK